jgi:hypothetical protein
VGCARNTLALFLILLCTPFVHAGTPVRTEVLADSGDVVVVHFEIGSYVSSSVTIDGVEYQEIELTSEPVLLLKGEPALPHVNRSVIIPDDARMAARVVASSYREIDARIAPSKGNLLRTVDPGHVPYEFSETYRVDAFYPGALAQLGEPHILRDHRGIVVQVNPFQYNPVTEVLRIYSEITVEVAAVGPGQLNVLDRSGRAVRPATGFREIYEAHFLNNEGSWLYDPIEEQGEMLIICHDPWIANVEPLAAHKSSIGIPTTIVGVSTIGNNDSAIKSYIQDVYDSSNLAYVLLVGDIQQVDSPSASGGASDPSYSKLAGGDSYPEIIVGRFSAASAGDVDTQVQRTIEYESDPATLEEWFWRGTGIGSAEGAGIGDEGQSDKAHLNEIREWLFGAGYTEVDQIYDPGANASHVSTAVNAGRGLINYTGHGSNFSWGSSGFNSNNVNSLTNTGKLPVIVSVACVNGEFDIGTCFAEAWLRATDDGEPTGAAATYMSSINQSWAPPMEGQDEFNLLLTDPAEPYHNYGALCFAGSASMMDDYGAAGVEMFNTWIIFGDPSLRIVGTVTTTDMMQVTPDTRVEAEGQAGGPFDTGDLEFTITNRGHQALDYEVQTGATWLTLDGFRGTILPGGNATVTAIVDESVRLFDNGDYEETLHFINQTNHSGDTTRSVMLRVGLQLAQEAWDLDENPGWATEGYWQYGQPAGQGGAMFGNPDPTSGATGQNVYGVNLLGDFFPTPQSARYLTSGPLDVGGIERVTLVNQRWLNIEGPPLAAATVEASADGADWTEVWSNTADVGDNAWSLESYDLTSVAGGRDTVYVRWGYRIDEPGAMPCSGWNLDDIEIWGVAPSAQMNLSLSRTELSWTPLAAAVSYDVVRGDLAALTSSGGDFALATDGCVAQGIANTTVADGDDPAPGEGVWLLVRGVSSAGAMTFESLDDSQVGLRDDEISASGVSCP